jgi:hypothetical protein
MKKMLFLIVLCALCFGGWEVPAEAYVCHQVDGDNIVEISPNCGGFSPCDGQSYVYINGTYVGTFDADSNILGPCVITDDLIICDLGDDEILLGCSQ